MDSVNRGVNTTGASLIFALFYYTLFMLLITILAAASCLSVFLVSHKRLIFFAFLGFLFYFFDVALVLQNDFATMAQVGNEPTYILLTSLTTIVTGLGFLGSFWLLICDYFDEHKRALIIAPCIVFVVGSGVTLLLPENDIQQFLFYTMRGLFLYWMLIYAGIRYLKTKNSLEKSRLQRHRRLYVLLWVFGLLVLIEDVFFFLIFDPAQIVFGPRSDSLNRNFSENLLMLCCMFFACRASYRTLSLRFKHPTKYSDEGQETLVEDTIALYGQRHKLSEREQEVLNLVLLGKDNQNIASSLSLSLSTVKVHVHNILQKTRQANRQELIQDFWRKS
ncbi:MAG: helix-turn-helix transcriptional regulator [Raoultibacter sp.]